MRAEYPSGRWGRPLSTSRIAQRVVLRKSRTPSRSYPSMILGIWRRTGLAAQVLTLITSPQRAQRCTSTLLRVMTQVLPSSCIAVMERPRIAAWRPAASWMMEK